MFDHEELKQAVYLSIKFGGVMSIRNEYLHKLYAQLNTWILLGAPNRCTTKAFNPIRSTWNNL